MAETEQAVNTTQTLSPCKVFTVSVLRNHPDTFMHLFTVAYLNVYAL